VEFTQSVIAFLMTCEIETPVSTDFLFARRTKSDGSLTENGWSCGAELVDTGVCSLLIQG
jgi:hypothetical protein